MKLVALLAASAALCLACSPSDSQSTPQMPTQSSISDVACVSHAASVTLVEQPNADGVLAGTLDIPAGCGKSPVALIIAGSGPTDRNGNGPGGKGPSEYELLARALSQSGFASLRYDKAGIGESAKGWAGREADLRFDQYVDDAALWLATLRADARFDRVYVIGHSEGSLIGMRAAKKVDVDGVVSIAGAGRPAGVVLKEQLAAKLADSALLATANHIIDELDAGRTVSEVPRALAALFRPSVQPYLISWMKLRPADAMRALSTRALIVQGSTDLQVRVVDARALHDAKPDAELSIIEGMNHVLKHASGDVAAQTPSYTDPSLPLAEGLVEAVAAFLAPR